MPKNIILILIIPFFIVGVLIWRLLFYPKSSTNFVDIKIVDTNYKIELAKTVIQKSKGLSQRQSLCQNCGMLFIFSFEGDLPFWMKDTLIPLDIIWLDKNGKIVDVKTASETNSEKILRNKSPAQYVLELNSGDFQKLNLKIDDIITLPKLND